MPHKQNMGHTAPYPRRIGVLIGLIVSLAFPVDAAEPPPRSVVMLSQSVQLSPWFSAVSSAFQSILAESQPPIAIFAEELDYIRFDSPQYDQLVSAFFREKYRGREIGVLVVNGEEALELAARLQSELWPGVPIVLTAIDENATRRSRHSFNVTGTTYRLTLHDSVAMARSLLPGLRRIVVLGDPLDIQPRHRRFKQEFLANPKGLELVDLTGRPMSEVKKQVASLPEDSIIIYTPITVDGAGIDFRPREAFAAITSVANRPILVDAENRIGAGALGGAVLRPALIGEEAARLVLRVLAGESASAIPIAPSKSVAPIFDWRELKRWKIGEGNLPAGSEIRFRQLSTWEQYRSHLVGVGFILLFQAAFILWLLFERRRRRLAELETRQRFLEVARLNRTATAGEMSAAIMHEINQPLGAILINTEAAEALLAAKQFDVEQFRQILSEIHQDDTRVGEIIKRMRNLLKKSAEVEFRELDLNDAVQDAIHILEPEAKRRGAILNIKLANTALPVQADRVQLQQVILNLALNGMDAMQQQPHSARVLELRTALVGDAEIMVSISDTGAGIPDDALKTIFQPFFSTKAQGSGLGLSIARTIIEAHKGKIWAENQPRGGAALRFTLPLSTEHALLSGVG